MATKRVLSVLMSMAVFASTFVPLVLSSANVNTAHAAGVALYADLTHDTNYPVVPATVTTQPLIEGGVSTDVYFSYVASSAFAAAQTVVLTFPSGYTIANTCGTPTTDADNSGGADGSGAVSGQQYTYTFSGSSDPEVEFCVDVTGPNADPQNGSVALSSNNDDDFGAAMVYVFETGTYQNRVEVTALVAPILQLAITDTSNAETDSCSLGVLNIVAVNTCAYRVYAGTNQTTGTATLQIADITDDVFGDASRDGLTKGGGGTDANNIDNTAANTDVAGGTEGTGIEAAATGTSFTLSGNFASTSDDPVPDGITTFATASGFINGTVGGGNYLTVTHRAAADAGTQTGSYVQWVQYTLISAP